LLSRDGAADAFRMACNYGYICGRVPALNQAIPSEWVVGGLPRVPQISRKIRF
jgi:hypothetical protein